jgi:hypothetical protein
MFRAIGKGKEQDGFGLPAIGDRRVSYFVTVHLFNPIFKF